MRQTKQDGTPEPDVAESSPLPRQAKRGQRLWLGIALVGLVFLLVILVVATTQ